MAPGSRLPLSFAQEGLWFLDQLNPGSAEYNVPLVIRIRGPLDLDALTAAFTWILERHEVLRATVKVDERGPHHQISPPGAVSIQVVYVDELTLERTIVREASRTFDLETGPLWRVHAWATSSTAHTLLLNFHHIVFDGWSLDVLSVELRDAYMSFTTGSAPALPSQPLAYVDYAAWQREWLTTDRLSENLRWWRGELAEYPTLALWTDHPRPPVRSIRGETLPVDFGAVLSGEIDALARREAVTPFMVCVAAFAIVLSRHTGQYDVVIGSPATHRPHKEFEGVLGFFVNTLALRIKLPRDPSVSALLERVRETVLGAFAHHDVPFTKIVEALAASRDLSETPLFRVMLVFDELPVRVMNFGGIEVGLSPMDIGVAKYDLTLRLARFVDGLRGDLSYRADLFERSSIERLIGHIQRTLSAMVAKPGQRVSNIQMLSAGELDRLLLEWNQTLEDDPPLRGAHQVFADRARRQPLVDAIVDRGVSLTYAELEARANRLARYLRVQVRRPEQVIAVCMRRSAAAAVALLAILKIGAAFVPVEPSYPRLRIQRMLEAAGASIVISDGVDPSLFPADARLVDLESERATIECCSPVPLDDC